MKISIKMVTIMMMLVSQQFVYAKPLVVGVAINDLNNPFFQQIVKGAKKKADELSHNQTKMMVVSSGYQVERQAYQISQLVKRNADIIVITAADPNALKKQIEQATRAGSQVIAVDVNAIGAMATVATDNVKAGYLACQHLAEKMNYKGQFAIINGHAVSAVIDRVQGCQTALIDYPAIQLVSTDLNGEGSQTGGAKVMATLLKRHPSLNAVFAINDPSAVGADLYAQNISKRQLLISSVDGAPLIQKALLNQTSLISASAAQYPDLMAEKAVELGYLLLNGQTLRQNIELIDPSLVTKVNVAQYQGWVK